MSDDIESAKEVIRELHGLIRDGRQLSREIREGRKQLANDVANVAAGMAAAYITTLDNHMNEHAESINAALNTANSAILVQAAMLADMHEPGEFLAAVTYGLTPIVAELTEKYLGKYAATVVEADELSRHHQRHPEPPTAVVSTVPSPFSQRPAGRRKQRRSLRGYQRQIRAHAFNRLER